MGIITMLACMFLSTQNLFAEALFLKDGTIMEGTVTGETDKTVSFKGKNNIKMEIPADSVLRVLEGEDYKVQYEFFMNDNTRMKAYIVDEDETAYTVRKELSSSDETVIKKDSVYTVVDEKNRARKMKVKHRQMVSGEKKYYSPKTAMWISLIPMYSGSLWAGTKPVMGMTFAVSKSIFFFTPLVVPMIGTVSKSDSGMSNNSVVDRYFKRKTYQIWAITSASIWLALTIGDMIYSYKYIDKLNEENGLNSVAEQRISVSFFSRVSMATQRNERAREIGPYEGFDAAVSLRF